MVSPRSVSAFLAVSLGLVSAAPTILGKDKAYDYALNTTSRVAAQQTITVAGSKFLTVHFSKFALAEGDVVSLSDASGKVVVEYTGLGRGDLGDKGGFYSLQVASSSVTVQYKPSPVVATSGDFGFVIDKLVQVKNSGSVSTVCSANQVEPPKCYASDQRVPQAFTKAKAVARLTINGGKYCTGWLIGSEGHMMTNHHCIQSQFEATNTQYEFSAEAAECDSECGGPGGCPGTLVATSAKLIYADKTLDYALVKLENPIVDLSQYGYLKLRVSGGIDQEQIYIPQHPAGKAKAIAVVTDDGSVTRATMGVSDICGSYRVGYVSDTEGGSSGSPVIGAKDNTVIGLHNCGTEKDVTVCGNSGTDVRALINDLKQKNILPADALDDPNAQLPDGPWIPKTAAPGPATPAPTADFCPGFKSSKSTCEVFTQGKCTWVGPGTCVKTDSLVAATPAPTTAAPVTPEPTTPPPTTPAPTDTNVTPEPTTPPPTTPAPTTPTPTTPAPTTPAPTTPAPTTSAPTTPAPTTPAPTTPAPTASTPTTVAPVITTVVPAATTAAPGLNICPGFSSKTTCEIFTLGKCQWVSGSCKKK